MKGDFDHASESFKRRNPNLFPAGICAAVQQPTPAPSLDRGHEGQQSGPQGVAVCITVYRPRLIDDDNFIGGCKYLRDAIAQSLGLDDAKIEWEYHQVKSQIKGTSVIVEI